MNRKETKLLVEGWRKLLFEMSRSEKIDYRENYGHVGAVRDALYAHWVFCGVSEAGMDQMVSESDKLISIEEKKNYFIEFSINAFESVMNKIERKEELSCNLIDPDKRVGVGTNYSGGGIDPWGYIGLILKPEVVTMAFDTNVGINIEDVGDGKLRKRTRNDIDYDPDPDQREDDLKNCATNIRRSFPLEDDEAYVKSVKSKPDDFFTYNQSEFVIVPKEIVGIIWLGGEFYFEDFIFDVFRGLEEELGQTVEELVEYKKNFEKSYLRSFCSRHGIEFFETEDAEIFDVPRLQSDL
tara:strand:+ start:1565 stop:2452 length:888 start_codon:yes stop_codon:yes gene_type:complete